MTKRARAKAPATVANVACGFDVFGFALFDPCDEVEASISINPGVRMLQITGDGNRLPLGSSQNTACVAVNAMLQHYGHDVGVSLRLTKNLPLSSGLGSSAASAVAALVAVNALLGSPYSRLEMLPFAMEGERVACGTAHADNVAPSLLGGFIVVRSYQPLDVISIPTPEGLCCAVVHPHIEVRTQDARRVIKTSIPLQMAVANWGNAAALVAGLYSGDFDLIGRSLVDEIFEPDRGPLIPGFTSAKAAAIRAGALGCSISGSGPSVFALCSSHAKAMVVAEAMKKAFAATGLESDTFVSAINREGAQILENVDGDNLLK
jgi:homoserine kinase